jgi:hypothetical protein
MRALIASAVAATALIIPATAVADDAGVLTAYQSQAAKLRAQDKQIAKLTKRFGHHRSAGPKAVKVLKAQQATLFQVLGAVQGQTESSPNGATAKSLCIQALQTFGKSDAAAIRAFVSARHRHYRKAAHSFKVATKLLKKAHKLDSQAGDAFHAAGVL